MSKTLKRVTRTVNELTSYNVISRVMIIEMKSI